MLLEPLRQFSRNEMLPISCNETEKFVKRLTSIVILLAVLCGFAAAQGSSASAPARSAAAPKIPYVTRTLANGLEVIVYPDSGVPLATVEIAVRNGSFTEPPELNGLSHLYEHMFFKTNGPVALYRCDLATVFNNNNYLRDAGCDRTLKLRAQYGDVSYLSRLDESGFIRNGSTQEEFVNYYYTATAPFLDVIMHGMRDAMLFPSFDEKEFEQEKQVVLGELDRNLSEPGYYLNKTMMDKLFYKYPSRKSPGGTRETVAAATTAQMRLIQSRYYVPNNAALVITGDVEPEKVFALAQQYFGEWKRGEDPFVKFPLVEHPPLPRSEGVFVTQDIDTAYLQIGWQGPSIGKDNTSTYAADVFSFIVGQANSRLQRKLVDSGLALGVDVHYYTQRNVGPIRITLITQPEKAKAALAALYDEIAHFTDADYFTDQELVNAITLTEARDLFEREKLSSYAHTLSFWWSSTGTQYYRGYYGNMRKITRADINRYINTYIKGKPHVGLAMMSDASQKTAALTQTDLIGK
ncbi:MAG: insulinase family protein [Chloracidobacterium sp.]|nr:insulinase family protein [Chloracidobacterium sp.]